MIHHAQDRRTKIVATLGPATNTRADIDALLAAGCDLFRLNFSHGTHDEHAARMGAIRAAEAELGRPVGVLQDLQGPKIRIGRFADPAGITLAAGDRFSLTADASPGDQRRVGISLPALIGDLAPGERVLLSDGMLEFEVVEQHDDRVDCRVITGGPLSDHKGINVPAADLSVPALSAKDVADLEFGAGLGVDWVALSFVRTADDLNAAREHLRRVGSRARLMAKIEKPGAVHRFASILDAADGIMVARGDLGVELPPEQVPVIQRSIIRDCQAVGKPVVVATQMLESMIANPRPTRAEASDVGHAIYDGADAVMLSGETAIGRHAAEAVAIMDRIAQAVESSEDYGRQLYQYADEAAPSVQLAVCHSACRLAEILPAEVVASFTWSGSTARQVAKHRPGALVVALTPFVEVARQLTIQWGVVPLTDEQPTSSDTMTAQAIARLRSAGLVEPGEQVIITAGVPFAVPGTTNLIRVERA